MLRGAQGRGGGRRKGSGEGFEKVQSRPDTSRDNGGLHLQLEKRPFFIKVKGALGLVGALKDK